MEAIVGMRWVGDLMAQIRALVQGGDRFAGAFLDLMIRLWLAGIF